MDFTLLQEFFQKYFVVHEQSAVRTSFSTYVCYAPDGLFWLNMYVNIIHTCGISTKLENIYFDNARPKYPWYAIWRHTANKLKICKDTFQNFKRCFKVLQWSIFSFAFTAWLGLRLIEKNVPPKRITFLTTYVYEVLVFIFRKIRFSDYPLHKNFKNYNFAIKVVVFPK